MLKLKILLLFKMVFLKLLLMIFLTFFLSTDAVCGSLADIAIEMNKLSYLPEYCQCRVAEGALKSEFTDQFGNLKWPTKFEKIRVKYIKIFGFSYNYLHHYCFGLRDLYEASQIDPINRKEAWEKKLEQAIGEFIFVQQSGGYQSFPLKAQLHTYKARTYNMLGEYQKAYIEKRIASKYIKKK